MYSHTMFINIHTYIYINSNSSFFLNSSIASDGFIIFYQVGACCVYTLFVVLNLKSVVDLYLEDELSLPTYLLMIIVPLLLINSLRNLKVLVPFSFLANAITFLTIGAVFYYIFETPLPSLSERPVFQSLKRFPLAYGTTCFAFTAVAVVSFYGKCKMLRNNFDVIVLQ